MTDAQISRKVSIDLQEISNVVLNVEFIFLETRASYLLASNLKMSGIWNMQKAFITRGVTSITSC